MESSFTNGWDFIISVIYTLAACVIIFMLKQPLSSLLTRNNVKATIPGLGEIEISPADAGGKISAIFNEFLERYDTLLNNYQKDLYRRIVSREHPFSVKELIPDFDRDIPEHLGALRSLRGIGLIVPERDGSWDENSMVVVTRFGREINSLLKRSL